MRPFYAVATALLVASPAIAKDVVPAATPVGAPVSCLRMNTVRETRVRSDEVIDFYTYGNKVYRNTLPIGCPQLGFEQRFVHKTSIDEYCSLDMITVLTEPNLSQGATCGLGQFQQVQLSSAK
jgi:hypothetical protein